MWTVHKFGGTSLANVESIRRVAEIVRQEKSPKTLVVVSAMAGVTNELIAIAEEALRAGGQYEKRLESLRSRHFGTAEELFGKEGALLFVGAFDHDRTRIDDALRGVRATRVLSKPTMDLVSGYGEVWSAKLLTAYLMSLEKPAAFLDARDVLVVLPTEIGTRVDWELSEKAWRKWIERCSKNCIVATGFIASTREGHATTLGRNGSDFSASIFGSLCDAEAITIWTDVDGVLTADPRRVPDAFVLSEMSYDEAAELAFFGAKVVHPNTMAPAIRKKIPIWVKNTFRPEAPGTKIHAGQSETTDLVVKGFSTIDGVSVLNVEGTGMLGVPGTASRVFGALKDVGVSVIMISQGSSEHSICLVVPKDQGEVAKRTLERAFESEMRHGQVERIELSGAYSILAAVGDGMVGRRGVAARLFQAIAKAQVNIRAIAQGSSERNISIVVGQGDSDRALRAAHAGFYLSPQTLSVGLIGPGSIGKTLMKQIHRQVAYLRERFRIDLRIRGILSSDGMLLSEDQIALDHWPEKMAVAALPPNLTEFVHHVHDTHLPHVALVDCTASDDIPNHYVEWLETGIHVITPNKKAGAADLARYKKIKSACEKKGAHYLYETTVGAGLPVISTLRDLIHTGDRIHQIEGVLSGTLSFVFNQVGTSNPFSAVVQKARANGYTEPDPRDDLSGMDVARKLVIMARELGAEVGVSDVEIESLVPDSLKSVATAQEFLERLPDHDGEILQRLKKAEAVGEVLRYVGGIDVDGRLSVRLKSYPVSHPFGHLTATDNIILFQSDRYFDQPLIVRGPGAGPEVTAAGVFADLLRLASYLGAPG